MDLYDVMQNHAAVFLLMMTRVSGLFVISPFFGSVNIPVYFRAGAALMISFAEIDNETRNRIFDYLNGVSYIINATVSKVSDSILLYAPNQVDVDKQAVKHSSWLSR